MDGWMDGRGEILVTVQGGAVGGKEQEQEQVKYEHQN
jgi:hypothetical protein